MTALEWIGAAMFMLGIAFILVRIAMLLWVDRYGKEAVVVLALMLVGGALYLFGKYLAVRWVQP